MSNLMLFQTVALRANLENVLKEALSDLSDESSVSSSYHFLK